MILGAGGFVGRHLAEFVNSRTECVAVDRKTLDFLDSNTYSNIDFTNTTIIDCVNVNNGNEREMMTCNVEGFGNFLSWLSNSFNTVHYVYLSTVSVLLPEAVEASAYVRSKKLAEESLKQSGLSYQIMRLSYPVGRGENPQRLLPKLISEMKNNRPLKLNDISINLNDVNDVVKDIYRKIGTATETFISSNNYQRLPDVIGWLRDLLKSESTIQVNPAEKQADPVSDQPFVPARDIRETLKDLI